MHTEVQTTGTNANTVHKWQSHRKKGSQESLAELQFYMKKTNGNLFLPKWGHWPLVCMILLNYSGGSVASQHPLKQAEIIAQQFFPLPRNK